MSTLQEKVASLGFGAAFEFFSPKREMSLLPQEDFLAISDLGTGVSVNFCWGMARVC